MFDWTENKIRWFAAAAEASGFYARLAEALTPWLDGRDTACDLGCGLGYLALALAPYLSGIDAVDISQAAVDFVEAKNRADKIRAIRPFCSDWREFTRGRGYDLIIFSFVSLLRANLPELAAICNKRIIAVLNNGPSGTGLHSKCYDPDWACSANYRETAPNTAAWLDARAIRHQKIPLDLEFGQPLRDRADALAFMDEYYDREQCPNQDYQAYLNAHLEERHGGLYLPKTKQVAVLIIEKKDLEVLT